MTRLLISAATLALLATSAAAQSTTTKSYDNRGSFAGPIIWNGQSWTRGNATSFSDGRGRFSAPRGLASRRPSSR
jgi:hypothetical protein